MQLQKFPFLILKIGMSDLIHSLVLSLRETAAEINGSCTNILVKESVPGEGEAGGKWGLYFPLS